MVANADELAHAPLPVFALVPVAVDHALLLTVGFSPAVSDQLAFACLRRQSGFEVSVVADNARHRVSGVPDPASVGVAESAVGASVPVVRPRWNCRLVSPRAAGRSTFVGSAHLLC